MTAQGGKFGIRSGTSINNNNTITIKKGSRVVASGTEAGIYGKVKNESAGAGWTNTEGTEGKADIAVNTEQGQKLTYKKVQFPVVEKYPLWVGSVQVTDENQSDVLGDGTVSFTPASGSTPATLTLNGANISGDNDNCTYDKASYAYGTIRTGLSDLTVNVTADSTVTGPGGKSEYSYGILGRETNLTVSGKGTLNVSGGSNGGYNGGIHSATITINGKVSAAGGEPDDSKYPSSTGEGLYPIKSITINEGAELTATAASSGGMAIYSRNKTLINAVAGIGWKTLQDSKTQTIQISTAGQPVPEFMKVRFPGTFTVTFDANGGSGTMKDVKDVSGKYELPESLFNAPDDKTFDCWLVEGKKYAVGGTITVTSDVTVKAQWKDMPVHVHNLTRRAEKKATCTEEGLKAHYICDKCDRWYDDATGLVEIRDKSSYVIDALGHEWGAWKQTKAPTAAEEGEETRTCSRCGEKETRSISASGNDKKDDANTDDRKDEGRKSGGKDRSSGSRSSSASGSASGHAQGQWRQTADGWYFDLSGGSQATGWQNILYNGRYGWYYFNIKKQKFPHPLQVVG